MKLLIVDNYDSFTYNIVETIRRIGLANYVVIKSFDVKLDEVADYDKIIFTPGPGLPRDYPTMFRIIEVYKTTKSILGVCLGHQAIAEYFGGTLQNFGQVVHGIIKQNNIVDRNELLFKNLPQNFGVGLYHSWFVDSKEFPDELKITSLSEDGIVMSLSHKKYNLCGVQFHPESIMTEYGETIIRNWLTV